MRIAANVATAVAVALAPSPVIARRDLPVPADKGWQHAASGVVLTATLAGMPRTALSDASEDERDVTAEFATPDRNTIATIYIFHPARIEPAIWFDRAQTTLELRDLYGGVRAASIQPTTFAAPGTTIASGLRQTYAPTHGPYRSTALAIAPVGDWLVAIRISSKTLDPVTIDPELTDVITAIRWPARAPGSVATPVPACASRLSFAKAKQKKPDITQGLLSGLLATAGRDRAGTARSIAWCREDMTPNPLYGLYRAIGTSDAYMLAIGDSGRVVDVHPAIALPGMDGTGGWSVEMTDLDGSVSTFPSFDKLPSPEQVLPLVFGGKATARTTIRDGKSTVTLSSPK